MTHQAVIVISLPTISDDPAPEGFTWALRQIQNATQFWDGDPSLGACRVYGSEDEAVVAHIMREFSPAAANEVGS